VAASTIPATPVQENSLGAEFVLRLFLRSRLIATAQDILLQRKEPSFVAMLAPFAKPSNLQGRHNLLV
jgi:hypothetical protein